MHIALSDDAAIALSALAEIMGVPAAHLANLALMSGLHSLHATARLHIEPDNRSDGPTTPQAPSMEAWKHAFSLNGPASINR